MKYILYFASIVLLPVQTFACSFGTQVASVSNSNEHTLRILFNIVNEIVVPLLFLAFTGHIIFIIVQKIIYHYNPSKLATPIKTKYIFYDIAFLTLLIIIWAVSELITHSMC